MKLFDELTHAAGHGVSGVGWPTQTWGMIRSFDQIHRLYEEIMHRPVWTHEMGTEGLKLMREELAKGMEPLNPLESFNIVSHGKPVIVLDKPEENHP